MKTERRENDPGYHASNIKRMLSEVIDHARGDVGKVTDPKMQALLETTAEVLTGLRVAYEHYEKKSEPAWV